MVKNETKRLHVTLDSIIGVVDSLIVMDTGSTDNTLDIIQSYKSKIPIHIHHSTFVDFSTSRNELLNFADTIEGICYYLLLDCNDEVRNGQNLRSFCQTATNSGYFVHQQWKTQKDGDNNDILLDYYNVRLAKAKTGCRYRGAVHEYLHLEQSITVNDNVPELVLYQDRMQDDNKSSQRYTRDLELLLADFKKEKGSRPTYYLAQTYACLGDLDRAYNYHKLRTTMNGFIEENFVSELHCGIYSMQRDWDVAATHFLRALDIEVRAEPLCYLAEHYISTRQFVLAEMFAYTATLLPYPNTSILFVDKYIYDYSRFRLHALAAYRVARLNTGVNSARRAYEYKQSITDKRMYDLTLKACDFYKRYPGLILVEVINDDLFEFIPNDQLILRK